VVLAVGTELCETDTHTFYDQLGLTGKVIRVDVDPGQLVRNAIPDVAITSDAGLALAALHAALGEDSARRATGEARTAALRSSAVEGFRPDYALHGRFLDAVAEALPGVIVVGDSTQPVYGGNLAYDPAGPCRWFNSSTGYGTLGYGLPSALGAKLAMPDRPIVSLIGDGGIQFTIGELATAVELGLPVPILLWNNQGYGEIKAYMEARAIPTIGVDIYTPDFQTIAKGFGCATAKPSGWAELAEALKTAIVADRPTVIEIDDAAVGGWS
jgi:acetolactate synthase-1/2/3 large subunit